MTTTHEISVPDLGDTGDQPVVRVRNLVKHFKRNNGQIVRAVDDVSFDLYPGEFVVLLGPSGCGKTSLLRSVAGLERPDSGSIEIHGNSVFDSERGVNLPPERRKISMIFQSYALWPHMTAYQNVAYPLVTRRLPKKEIGERVREVLALVGIADLERQHPGQMSGGQQQRVALARAVVANDRLVLFDEPLSNVDAKVREQLRLELISMQRKLGFAALYVTHDQLEAMELAHRIAVMDKGSIAQLGAPREVYEAPTNRYVAGFVGTVNEIHGVVAADGRDGGTVEITTSIGTVRAAPSDVPLETGQPVVAVWRPEGGILSRDEPSTPNRWRAAISESLFAGSHTEYLVEVGDTRFRLWRAAQEALPIGAELWLSVDPKDTRVLARDE